MRQALAGGLVALVACLSASADAESSMGNAPDVELAVYGSGSFKEGLAIGDSPYAAEAGYNRFMVSGSQSEISFHDRSSLSCTPSKRWNLYAANKCVRSHRPGGSGGFKICEDGVVFNKDLNIGGVVDMKTLGLKGDGEQEADYDSKAGSLPPVMIGDPAIHHMKMGYATGHAWIQSVKTHMAMSPGKSAVSVGTTDSLQKLTVGGADNHLRVNDELTVGGSDGKAYIGPNEIKFEKGGGWEMTDTSYVKTKGDRPAYTKAGGRFFGNVGIGTMPKFPIFRLQVHLDSPNDHGAVMVTDKSERGLTLGQTKAGALLRSWNMQSGQHEAMLVEASPLLIQPRSGVVLFGTTVRKAEMQLHVEGNLYIHGHMFAMKNLHVRDHAKLAQVLMPSLTLKNVPQSPDGDTLVLGHQTKVKEAGTQESAPWEDPSKALSPISGVNLRLGFHKDYTWIQVHGSKKGRHFPLALNPLGNTVAIGTSVPDKAYRLHAQGNGYCLGTLYVKMGQSKTTSTDTAITDYSQLMTSEDATEALSMAKVQRTEQEDLLKTRLTLIDIPEKLKASKSHTDMSVQKVTGMFHAVLAKQERHMTDQDDTLKRQATKIAQLQARLMSLQQLRKK